MLKSIKRLLLIAALLVPWVTNAQCVGTECTISISGTDLYSDGWNGASIGVYQGTTLRGTFTLTDGASNSATFLVCSDDSVRFVWNSGNYDDECTFTIINGNDSVIIADAAGDLYSDGAQIAIEEVVCPSCPAPSGLLAVTDETDVDLSWTDNNGTGWQIAWGLAGFDPNTETVNVDNVSSTSATITGLSDGLYDVYVRTDCGTEFSNWIHTSFAIGGCAITVVGHDSYGDGWNGGSLDVVQGGSVVSTVSLADGNLVTSNINVSGAAPVYFVWHAGSYVSEVSIDIYDGSGSLKYSVEEPYGDTIYTMLSPCPTCGSVGNLQSVATIGAALVSWTAGMLGEYDGSYVIYKPDTATVWDETSTTGTSITLTGLAPSTNYEVRVYALCTSGDTASYESTTFTTGDFDCILDPTSSINVTVGAGSSTNSYVPSYSTYNYGYSQQFFRASEIGSSGQISKITLTPSAVGSQRTYEIYMGQSSDSSASTFITPDNLTLVYNGGHIPLTAGEPVTFELTTPFNFSDTANLVVIFRDLTGSWSSGTTWVGDNAAWSDASAYAYRDASSYAVPATESPSNTTSFRNQITFYGGTCIGTATCAAPAVSITAVDTNTVTLAWVPGADENTWEVWYRNGNNGPYSVAEQSVTTTEYTVNNLQPGTMYYFMVVNVCDPDTFYSNVVNTFTECAPSDGFFENFNSYQTETTSQINLCWYKSYYNGSQTNYPYVSTINGEKALYFYGYTSGSSNYYDWVVGPEMRDSINAYEIEFDMWKTSTTSYYTSRVLVGAMSDPTDLSTFDTIADITDAIYGSWQPQYVSFENYHGDGRYIALLAPAPGIVDPSYTYGYNYCYIDNVFVGHRSSCAKPSRFHARDIAASSAVLAWDSVEAYMSANILYNTVNDTANAMSVTTTNASVALSGLTPNTTYYCWISASCADDDSRTVSCTFTTTATCNPVVDLTVAEATSSVATITWASDPITPATDYTFEWKNADSTQWNSLTTSNTYYQLTSLDEGATYNVRVYANCSEDDTSLAANISFATTITGTIGSNEGTYYLPTYPFYNYSISEQMWTASELAVYSDTIYGIYFNAASSISGRDMKMWVTDTTLADLSTTNYVSSADMTLVMDTTLNINAGWTYLPFNHFYVRDLSKNLVVLVYDSTGSYSSFNGYYATSSAVNSLHAHQDGSPYSTTDLGSLTAEGVRAMMRLDADLVEPDCLAPHPVVAETAESSITLNWVAGLNETSWIVEYRSLAESTWTVAEASTTSTTATINNLEPSTTYIFRIGALCSGDTLYAALRGTTSCGIFNVPFVEDFNSYSSNEYDFDPCWYKGNSVNTNMPYIVNITGAGLMTVMPMGSYMILPQMNVPVSQLQLRLQYVAAQTNIYTLVGVCSHPEDILSMTIIDTLWCNEAGVAAWVTVPMDAYTGEDGYITLYSPINNGYVDNLNVEMIPQCGTVDSVSAINIGTTTADIQWQAGTNAGSYIIEYGPLGTNTFNVATSSALTVSLTNLLHSTTYNVNIYSVCPTLSDTSLAANFKFTTACDTVSLPYFEDFEHCNAPALTLTGILPNCWNYMFTSSNSGYSGPAYIPQLYSGTTEAHSGQYSLRTYGQAIITLPEMPTDVNQLQLSMHDYVSSYSYGLVIGVCDSNWGNFEQSFVGIDTIMVSTSGHYDFTTYRLASYTGTGRYIAFKNIYVNSSYTYAYSYNYIDDISIDYLPSCLPVDNLHCSANTSSSITIDWTDLSTPSNEWEVSYSTSQLSDPSTGTTAVANVHPYTINGLTGGTNYYVYVRNICGVGDTSIWTALGPVTPGSWTMRANQTDTVYMCGGVIYDDGGANGQYSDNQSSYVVIMPDAPGALVSVSGWTNDESSFDYLIIYDGVGNSGAQLYSSNVSGSYNGTFTDLVSSSGPLTLYFHSDGSIHNYNGFEVNVSCLYDDCPVSDIEPDTNATTSTSIALNWTGSSTSYDVVYGPAGFDIDNEGTALTTTTNSITIGNLTAITAYDIYVRGLCNSGDTGMWHYVSVTTLMCDNATEVLVGDTNMTTSTAYTVPVDNYYNYTLTEIIIDSAEMGDITEITAISFYYDYSSPSTVKNDVDIYIMPTTDSVFASTTDLHIVDTSSSAANRATLVYSGALNCSQGWNVFGLNAPYTWDGHSNLIVVIDDNSGDYDGSSYVFRTRDCSGSKTLNWYSDTENPDPTSSASFSGNEYVREYRPEMKLISCGAVCAKPALLPVTGLDYANATLNWNSNATDFEVSVKAATEGTWPTPVAVSNATSYTVTGLNAAMQYQYMVRAICDATENLISDWATGSFTTDSLPCFTPTDLHTTNEGYTSATLAWTATSEQNHWTLTVWNTAGAVNYDVTGNAAYTVTGLTQNTAYNAAVKAICGNGAAESEYSDTIQFTTNNCEQVTGVTVTNITDNSAVVSWQAATATSYEVDYGPVGHGQGQGTTVTVNDVTTYTITGLESETGYSVYVRALCEADAPGPWSQVQEFTTLEGGIGIDVADGMNVSIYPNPTSSTTTIALSGVNGDVAITVVDMNGRVVMSDSMSCEGDCVKTMEVSGLAQGAYFVRINGENVNMVKKLVVK